MSSLRRWAGVGVTEIYDTVVVGGGIIAARWSAPARRRAIARCWVERDDYGAGTSSKTSRFAALRARLPFLPPADRLLPFWPTRAARSSRRPQCAARCRGGRSSCVWRPAGEARHFFIPLTRNTPFPLKARLAFRPDGGKRRRQGAAQPSHPFR